MSLQSKSQLFIWSMTLLDSSTITT